jgi:hypothetical protein
VNFFTGFNSSNGATPAKLFHISTKRVPDHSALSSRVPSRFRTIAGCGAPAGPSACAAMLLSESMVNVAMWLLLCRLYFAVVTFIALIRRNIKWNLSDHRCQETQIVGGRSFFLARQNNGRGGIFAQMVASGFFL